MAGHEDDGPTRLNDMPPPSPDEQATGHVADVGIVAELRALLTNGEEVTLPLYALPDQIVVGRGTASDWQLDDDSLSRKHAQFKWSGRELTVEDLGSANGTLVGGRPARSAALPVKPGEIVKLGTVAIRLEMRGASDADGQSTRLVVTPESRPQAFPQLPGMATVVKPPSVARPIPAQPQVFVPSREAARPEDATRPWDPRAALVHASQKAFDGELMDRLGTAWRENRRPFVLAGAALWVGVILTVLYIYDRTAPSETDPAPPPPVLAPMPKVTSLAPPPPAPPVDPASVLSADERDDVLAQAVAAYDTGRLADALGLFRRLAADPQDSGARFMVDLIESRLPPPGAP